MNIKKLIILYSFLAGGMAANSQNTDYIYLKMQSAPFEVNGNYLSKHDIVYFSPTQLEAEGFPMGNGYRRHGVESRQWHRTANQ